MTTHKVLCAWHEKNFGAELVIREGEEPVSHGICRECRILEGLTEELENFLHAEPETEGKDTP